MSVYASTEQLYRCLRALFAQIQAQDPGAADALAAARLIIRLRCTGPAGELVINGRHRPVETTFGPTALRPDLDVELAADTLHAILLGNVSLKKSLASGQLKVRGPIHKAMALADLFRQSQAIYPQVLRDHGLTQ